jgi:hypothetical protein
LLLLFFSVVSEIKKKLKNRNKNKIKKLRTTLRSFSWSGVIYVLFNKIVDSNSIGLRQISQIWPS